MMSILHTVNKSPFTSSTLNSCLKVCTKNDGILLLEDGVFGAIQSTPCIQELQSAMNNGISVFVLGADVNARGIEKKLTKGIQLTDYNKFVQLTLHYSCVQSWY